MKKLINKIYELRREIDGQIQFNKRCLSKTSETTRSLRSLELAKGWLGKTLYFMGETTPYSQAKSVEDIPDTADKANTVIHDLGHPVGQLEGVNFARREIDDLLKILSQVENNYKNITPTSVTTSNSHLNVVSSIRNSWTHLHEASMNLGFERQRLREESENNDSKPVDGRPLSDDYFTRTVTIKVPRDHANSFGLAQTIGATLQRIGDGIREALPSNKSRYYGKEDYFTGDYGTIAWVNKVEDDTSYIMGTSPHPAPSFLLYQELLYRIYHGDEISVDDFPKVNDAPKATLNLIFGSVVERRRQVTEEGYTAHHDDAHTDGEILIAAANYLLHDTDAIAVLGEEVNGIGSSNFIFDNYWPWEKDHNKADKHDFWRRMEIAIAWILAEAERRWRAENK